MKSMIPSLLLLLLGIFKTNAFVVVPATPVLATTAVSLKAATTAAVAMSPLVTLPSIQIAATTLDPTTFLSDLLSGVTNTPIILAVPIVAALAVAGLIAFAIIAYANPAED